MNSMDHLLMASEAESWKFCEGCGKELGNLQDYRHNPETGERYVYAEFHLCPDCFGITNGGSHTRIEIVPDPEEEAA